jgi:tRNA-2-methylthio-N6-dimethylallyladenosine synthase
VRFTSPHPNDFSARVIQALAEVPAVCEHVHLPMQSGSTEVLKRMLRRYTREEYFDCLARLRAAIPGLSVTTDIIVGFPGETEAHFQETISAVHEAGFSDAFMFKFSPREGTPATRMPAEWTVSDDIASDRMSRLVDAVKAGARQQNLGLLGRRCEVLIEREARRGGDLLQARTRDFRTVLVPGEPSMIGRYVTVELTGTTGSTFTGSVLRERPQLPLAG